MGMDTKNNSPAPVDPLQYQAWLDEILPTREAAAERGVSVDTLKRDKRLKGKWLHISTRLLGLRRRDARMIS
jgi:hypothetical protein